MAQQSSGGSITVVPNGQTLSVTITATTGALPTVYSDEGMTSPVTFPKVISSNATYFVARDCYATVSCLIGGVESATATGATFKAILFGGTRTVVRPTPNLQQSAGQLGASELAYAATAATQQTLTGGFVDVVGAQITVGPTARPVIVEASGDFVLGTAPSAGQRVLCYMAITSLDGTVFYSFDAVSFHPTNVAGDWEHARPKCRLPALAAATTFKVAVIGLIGTGGVVQLDNGQTVVYEPTWLRASLA